jgi:hypothetical protein
MLTGTTGNEIIVELKKRGVEAFWEYPGYVSIPLPDNCRLNLADGSELLGVQHCAEDGELIEDSIDSDIPSDTKDALAVADFLAVVYTQALEVL